MSEKKASQKGGFHFGNVGRDVKIEAGGDVIAGNKTTTTTINRGFKEEKDKEEFVRQINELHFLMGQMRSQIENLEGFDEDNKKQIVNEIMLQVTALKAAKEAVSAVPVGKEAPQKKVEIVGEYLDQTTTLIEKLQKMGEKTAEFTNKVAPIIAKSLPILVSARHLFGLP